MIHPSFYSPENARRIRSAQLGIAALSGIVCTYLVATTAMGMRDAWSVRSLLRQEKTEVAALSRQEATERRQEAARPRPSAGGVDAFAVILSGWADARGIRIESVVPEGSPAVTQVNYDSTDLGTWNTSRVRVKGTGQYHRLMDLLDKFRRPGFPVQIASFGLQAAGDRGEGIIAFDLVFVVYKEKGRES